MTAEACTRWRQSRIVIPSGARDLLVLLDKQHSRFLAPKSGARNDNSLPARELRKPASGVPYFRAWLFRSRNCTSGGSSSVIPCSAAMARKAE